MSQLKNSETCRVGRCRWFSSLAIKYKTGKTFKPQSTLKLIFKARTKQKSICHVLCENHWDFRTICSHSTILPILTEAQTAQAVFPSSFIEIQSFSLLRPKPQKLFLIFLFDSYSQEKGKVLSLLWKYTQTPSISSHHHQYYTLIKTDVDRQN